MVPEAVQEQVAEGENVLEVSGEEIPSHGACRPDSHPQANSCHGL